MFRRWAANVPTRASSRRRGNSQRTFACFPSTRIRMRGWDSARRNEWPLPVTTTRSPSMRTCTSAGMSTNSSLILRPASPTSIDVGEEFPAHAHLLRLRLRDDPLRRREDEDPEILRGQVPRLVLLELLALDRKAWLDHTAVVDAPDEADPVQVPAAVLHEFERANVLVVLHHLEHAADQLRRRPDDALGLAGRLGVADRRHRIVEWILEQTITSAVLPEAELVGDLAEALAAQVQAVAADDPPLPSAAEASFLPAEILRPVHSTTSTLKCTFMNSMPSDRETRWERGIRRAWMARRATRQPGRCRLTLTSIPNTPISGSYFIPGKSVSSWIP